MAKKPDLPVISFVSQSKWGDWLQKNHSDCEGGIWLRLFKKDSGQATFTYAEALEEALCYGWIDGQKKSYDEISWLQKFTPRRARSLWSKVNTGHAERLIGEGRMKPAGLRQVEAAKQDGRWEQAYEAQSTATVPEDFLDELRKDRKAAAFFETLNKSNRYAIIYRLQSAKKPETRAQRLQAILKMLDEGRKFHP